MEISALNVFAMLHSMVFVNVKYFCFYLTYWRQYINMFIENIFYTNIYIFKVNCDLRSIHSPSLSEMFPLLAHKYLQFESNTFKH